MLLNLEYFLITYYKIYSYQLHTMKNHWKQIWILLWWKCTDFYYKFYRSKMTHILAVNQQINGPCERFFLGGWILIQLPRWLAVFSPYLNWLIQKMQYFIFPSVVVIEEVHFLEKFTREGNRRNVTILSVLSR